MDLKSLLATTVRLGASDLHLVCGSEAVVRIDGELVSVASDILTPQTIQNLCYEVLSEERIAVLNREWELDFALDIDGVGRFRANLYHTLSSGDGNGALAAAFRVIPNKIPSLADLGSPAIFSELAMMQKGLVLITGATGSGKSTTLAAMLNEINQKARKHIITIEDPIEFIHQNGESLFSQRSVGEHTKSFSTALKQALREDPDVILVGEMRDASTIFTALSAAETGHLVLATLHTNSAASSVSRIVSSFSGSEQTQVRNMLASSLNAIISQTLLPKIGGGRTAIYEILINSAAIANLIREDRLHQIESQMQINRAATGMQTAQYAASEAVAQQLITKENAVKYGLLKAGER